MRKIRRVALLAGVVLVLFPLSGCMKDAADKVQKAAADPVAEAGRLTGITSSYELDLVVDQQLRINDQEVPLRVASSSVVFNNPIKTKTTLVVESPSFGKVEAVSYLLQKGDVVKGFTGVNNQWVPSGSMSVSAVAKTDYAIFLENFSSFRQTGSEMIGGKEALVFEGVLTGQSISGSMASSGVFQLLSVTDAGINEQVLRSAILPDAGMKVWIDKESNYPVKLSLDLTGGMDVLLKSLYGQNPKMAGVKVSVSRYVLEMTMKDYNKVVDFAVPQEVLNAL